MNGINPVIKCKKCGNVFEPDMKTRGVWKCPLCLAQNPNLKRHYRSVADLFILGLIFTGSAIAVGFAAVGLSLGVILLSLHSLLLLTGILCVYRSATPWTDRTVKTLIWVVFGLAALINLVLPLVLYGRLNTISLAIYAIIFPYLFWLHAPAGKCSVLVPPLPLAAGARE